MVDGVWHGVIRTDAPGTTDIARAFADRPDRTPLDPTRLKVAPGDHHLYAAKACPFAHRVLLARAAWGFDAISVTYADPWLGGPDGWRLAAPRPSDDPVPDATRLWMVYAADDPRFTGRVAVPVLWDRMAGRIASAESLDILRALHSASGHDPGDHAREDQLHDRLNLGPYRAAFAPDQAAYDAAVDVLFETLRDLDATIRPPGAIITPEDILVFVTGIRWDAAYHGAFQLLTLRWHDYPNLQSHLEAMLARPEVAATVDVPGYRVHYFDDAAFPIRHPKADGRYILPKTPDPFGNGHA